MIDQGLIVSRSVAVAEGRIRTISLRTNEICCSRHDWRTIWSLTLLGNKLCKHM